jgi:hypothetical protein
MTPMAAYIMLHRGPIEATVNNLGLSGCWLDIRHKSEGSGITFMATPEQLKEIGLAIAVWQAGQHTTTEEGSGARASELEDTPTTV